LIIINHLLLNTFNSDTLNKMLTRIIVTFWPNLWLVVRTYKQCIETVRCSFCIRQNRFKILKNQANCLACVQYIHVNRNMYKKHLKRLKLMTYKTITRVGLYNYTIYIYNKIWCLVAKHAVCVFGVLVWCMNADLNKLSYRLNVAMFESWDRKTVLQCSIYNWTL